MVSTTEDGGRTLRSSCWTTLYRNAYPIWSYIGAQHYFVLTPYPFVSVLFFTAVKRAQMYQQRSLVRTPPNDAFLPLTRRARM